MNSLLRLGRIAPTALAFAMILTGVSGCSSDGGDGTPVDPGNPVPLSGFVLKGAVAGATVSIHAITATGEVGASVGGPFTTDASGRWSGEVPAGTAGAHAVTANGGSYTDESTGSTVNLSSEMRGIVMVGPNAVGNVTPITHAVFANAAFRMQLGMDKETAFASAIGDMSSALGFDPTTLTPPVGRRSSHDIYDVILAGFSALLDSNPALGAAFDNAETWAIVEAVATDLADGTLDGIDILGNGILVDDGTGQGTFLPFPPLDASGIGALIAAANAWAATNAPGITIPDIDLSAFGSPTFNPGGEYIVGGSLTVTGPDADLFVSIFDPVRVDLDLASSSASGINSITFYLENPAFILSFALDPNGTREFNNISAWTSERAWFSPENPPSAPWVGGALFSQLGDTFKVSLTDVVLSDNFSEGTPRLILNGDLSFRMNNR